MQNERKPKIAVIGLKGLPAFGGAARSNSQLLSRLKNEFDITIYTINTHHLSNYDLNGLRVINIKGFRLKRFNTFHYYLTSAFHCLFKGSYDIVQLNHLYSGYIVPLLKLRYKVILTAHGIVPKDDNKWNFIDKIFFKLFENIALKFADLIISVSKPHIDYFRMKTAKPIIYIPNGAETLQSTIENENKKNYLLFAAARIISLKGCHTFLEALNLINYKEKIIIVGDIEQVENYKIKIKKLTSSLDVEFTGLIKDKSKLYKYVQGSKYFIFPSFNEGLSNMLLEVASLKTPIIASDIIENKSVFDDNEVLYFKTGDAKDLSEKISWALANDCQMKERSEKAYNKVITEYNWDNISKQYSILYNDIINGVK